MNPRGTVSSGHAIYFTITGTSYIACCAVRERMQRAIIFPTEVFRDLQDGLNLNNIKARDFVVQTLSPATGS